MKIVHARVRALANRHNGFLSAFDVCALEVAPGQHWVVITDIDDGPSITNTAETACPQIAARLGLAFDACRFFERYRHRDPVRETLDRILFRPVALQRVAYAPRAAMLSATLAVPGWRPAATEEVDVLRTAGVALGPLACERVNTAPVSPFLAS